MGGAGSDAFVFIIFVTTLSSIMTGVFVDGFIDVFSVVDVVAVVDVDDVIYVVVVVVVVVSA